MVNLVVYMSDLELELYEVMATYRTDLIQFRIELYEDGYFYRPD